VGQKRGCEGKGRGRKGRTFLLNVLRGGLSEELVNLIEVTI